MFNTQLFNDETFGGDSFGLSTIVRKIVNSIVAYPYSIQDIAAQKAQDNTSIYPGNSVDSVALKTNSNTIFV